MTEVVRCPHCGAATRRRVVGKVPNEWRVCNLLPGLHGRPPKRPGPLIRRCGNCQRDFRVPEPPEAT